MTYSQDCTHRAIASIPSEVALDPMCKGYLNDGVGHLQHLRIHRLIVSEEGTVVRPSALLTHSGPYETTEEKDRVKRSQSRDDFSPSESTMPQLVLERSTLRLKVP